MRFAHRLLMLTICTSTPCLCPHPKLHILDCTHFVVGLIDANLFCQLLVGVVDRRSALHVEGLGLDPRQQHEPHKFIYLKKFLFQLFCYYLVNLRLKNINFISKPYHKYFFQILFLRNNLLFQSDDVIGAFDEKTVEMYIEKGYFHFLRNSSFINN